MSEYAVAPVSSDGGGSSLKRDGGGAQRRKEYATIEAMRPHCSRQSRRSHCSPSPRRPHCSNCATVETLPLLDGGLRRSDNSVYLDGRRRAGPDLGPTCPDLSSDFFLFLKTDFRCRVGTADTKNNLIFVS
jgi:hypothetical protein